MGIGEVGEMVVVDVIRPQAGARGNVMCVCETQHRTEKRDCVFYRISKNANPLRVANVQFHY